MRYRKKGLASADATKRSQGRGWAWPSPCSLNQQGCGAGNFPRDPRNVNGGPAETSLMSPEAPNPGSITTTPAQEGSSQDPQEPLGATHTQPRTWPPRCCHLSSGSITSPILHRVCADWDEDWCLIKVLHTLQILGKMKPSPGLTLLTLPKQTGWHPTLSSDCTGLVGFLPPFHLLS